LCCWATFRANPAAAAHGIALCGSGIGISIACNKIEGIRAALCHDYYTAQMCRRVRASCNAGAVLFLMGLQHNNSNVLCLGGRTTGSEVAKQMVDVFLETQFDGGRHQIRVDKIAALEKQ